MGVGWSISPRWALRLALLGCLLGAIALASAAHAQPSISLSPSTTQPYYLCPQGPCQAIIDPAPTPAPTRSGFALAGGTALEGSGELGGYDPSDLRSAYKLPRKGGAGQTVAVVDPLGYTMAEADLNYYRNHYGLRDCRTGNHCFTVVNQDGNASPLPPEQAGTFELALDIQMVSAICPECHILLVEVRSFSPADEAAGVNTAARLGATEISNSYGYAEGSGTCGNTGCSQYAPAYDHPGIAVVAGSGDSGFDNGAKSSQAFFPSAAPGVISVGGTTLHRAANARGWSETAWAGSGSGCSVTEPKPPWQSDPGCPRRTTSDVSAIGDFQTPVSVRLSVRVAGGGFKGKWWLEGGTSTATPIVAAIEAHASSYTRSLGASAFYQNPGMLLDVTSGKNGECPAPYEYLCSAGPGYDGPTGWGTPNGVFEVPEP
jgi:subtilase family serine protease